MTFFIFPYNLHPPLMAGTQSSIASFGAILVICGAMALVLHRVLPPRVSLLQIISVIAVWAVASLGGLQLVLAGVSIP